MHIEFKRRLNETGSSFRQTASIRRALTLKNNIIDDDIHFVNRAMPRKIANFSSTTGGVCNGNVLSWFPVFKAIFVDKTLLFSKQLIA